VALLGVFEQGRGASGQEVAICNSYDLSLPQAETHLFGGLIGAAEEAAEKRIFATLGLTPFIHLRTVIAALEALRHPRSWFFRNL